MSAVSVIVPMYNTEKTIGRCLDSILAQTLQDIDIIVVDDGSPDNGAEIVSSYERKDNRVKMIRQANMGLGAARNTGVAAASGEYIGFVDSDDYIAADMYEKLYDAAVRNNAEIAVCQEKDILVYADGKQTMLGETRFECSETVLREDILKYMFNYRYLNLNSSCLKIFKRDMITDNEILFPTQYRYAEDMVFSAACFFKAEKTALVAESLYFYVRDGGIRSITSKNSVKNAEDILQNAKDIVSFNKKEDISVDLSNFIYGMKFSSLKQVYRIKGRKDKIKVRELKNNWDRLITAEAGKPSLKGVQMPFMHKVKVWAGYHKCIGLLCFFMKCLNWLPFFKYMT